MIEFGVSAVMLQPVLARGRGIGRLIQGLYEGDPFAIGITVVTTLGLVGYYVYKHVSGSGDE